MEIRFYDFEGNLVGHGTGLYAAKWQVKFNGIGTFEGRLATGSHLARVATAHDYLIITQGSLQAIVLKKVCTEDEMVLFGKTLNWILSRRVLVNARDMDGTASELVRLLVGDAFSDAPQFALAPSAILGEVAFRCPGARRLSDVVISLLGQGGGGHRVTFQPASKKWYFHVKGTRDSGLVLSAGLGNVCDASYTADLENVASEGYYQAADGTWNKLVREEKTGLYRWEVSLSQEAAELAAESLAKRTPVKTSNAGLLGLRYETDYQLGDIVRLQTRLGSVDFTEQKVIDEVQITIENGWREEKAILR